MPILGLTDKIRLPRAGTIRLGIKKTKIIKKDGEDIEVEYPSEVNYFVCPELVQRIYGPEPKCLVILFPVENEEVFFQQWYKRYGNGILLCKGDGVEASCWNFDTGQMEKIKCPCEHLENGSCKAVGNLQVLLPEVEEAAGVWQINTGSKNSIIDLNSGIKFIRAIAGRIAMIPLLLKREPLETHRIEGKELKRGKHFTMKLSLEGMSFQKLQLAAKIKPTEIFLPPADESQPDDLFPKNGFKPEEDAVEVEPEKENSEEEKAAFKKAEFIKLGHDLELLLKEYQDAGGKIGPNQQTRIKELATAIDVQKAIGFFKAEKAALAKKARPAKNGGLF